MRLTATAFVTIDGIMQSPGAPEEDPSNGFDLGGWLPPYFDDQVGQYMASVFGHVDAFLLGRFTYETFAGYWPNVTDPANPIAGKLNSLPKYVVTSTLKEVTWNNSRLITGDIVKEVNELKQQPGRELQIHGSAALINHLTDHGLIDAYRVLTFPVVLGRGKRLFAEGSTPTAFKLTETDTTGSGVVIHSYQNAGKPTFGSVL
jgi:dihydrofolate reductase